MRIRASIHGLATVLALAASVAIAASTTGCIHAGTVAAKEPPPLAYQAPDIDELTGIETPAESDAPPAAPQK